MYYIGNSRSKELHYDYCPWARLMTPEHQRRYDSVEQALASDNYDPCGHCEPFTREPKKSTAYDAKFEVLYQGDYATVETNIARGEPLELKATIFEKGTEIPAPAGMEVKFTIAYHIDQESPLGSAVTDEKGEANLTHKFSDNISSYSIRFTAYFPNTAIPASVTRYVSVADMITKPDFSPKTRTSGTTQFQFTLDAQASGHIRIYRRVLWFFWPLRKTLHWQFDEAGTKHVNWNGTDDSGKKMWGVFKAEIGADTWPRPKFDRVELRDIKRKR